MQKNPLMPFIEDFEKAAEGFLKNYGYAEAITNPMPVPIESIIVKRMTLDIIDTERLSPDDSVQGIIAFSEGIVQVYDEAEKDYVGFELKGPAILLDSEIWSDAYRNQFLTHEAFHWYKHRAYFIYRNEHGQGDEFAFRCSRRYAGDQLDAGWTDEQRMEWQARKIVPMILLPRRAFLCKLYEIANVDTEEQLRAADITPQVITRLANFFGVTTYMVQKRMQSLNLLSATENIYKEGKGKASSNRKLRPVSHKTTSFISLEEAFSLYLSNELFRTYLDSGMFRYWFNGFHTVIQTRSGDSSDELLFTEVLIPVSDHGHQDDVMFHGNQHYETKKQFRNTPQNVAAMDQVRQWADQFQYIHDRHAANAKTANEVLWEYMQLAHWNTRIFQDRTLLSPMDYTRVQKKEHIFKLPTYVAMAVGLGLTLMEFQDVIQKAGMCLIKGNTEHDAYSFVLTTLQGAGIDRCNEFLHAIGIPTLGTHERDDTCSQGYGKECRG